MPIRLHRPRLVSSLEEISRLLSDASSAGSALVSASEGDPVQAASSPSPPFLSLRESADWLCVSISTVKRLIAKGTLGTVRVGARRKIPASFLAAHVARDILLPDQVQDKEFS
jgi:excisionase family DNA binding protein